MKSNLHCITILLILCVSFASLQRASKQTHEDYRDANDTALTKFIQKKMLTVGLWIGLKGYDPSPIVTGSRILDPQTSFLNISCSIKNLRVAGISAPSYILMAEGSFQSNEFDVGVMWYLPTFYGYYEATGTLFDNITLNASGKFQIQMTGVLTGIKKGFIINSDGFIDIANYTRPLEVNTLVAGYWHRVNFEGLLPDDAIQHKDLVFEPLYDLFSLWMMNHYLDYNGTFPGGDLFLEYFTDVFSKTSVADIINTNY